MPDERAPERRAQRLGPEAVAHTNFPTAVRGYDRDEVRAFLNQVAGELRESRDREALLRTELQALTERLAQRDHLDEAEITALLGEETARVLTTAREAAADIRAKGEESVARLLREAQDEATRLRSEAETVHQRATGDAEEAAKQIRGEAEAHATELRAEARALVAEATAEAERLQTEAQRESSELRERATADAAAAVDAMRADAAEQAAAELAAARNEAQRLVQEAQVVRERVLKDLSRKRKAARSQLEQLRAGRDRLLDAYAVVERTLAEANAELHDALPEAKLAAEAAAQRIDQEPDDSVEQLEAEVAAARDAGLPLVEPEPAQVAEPAAVDESTEPVESAEPSFSTPSAPETGTVSVENAVPAPPPPPPPPPPASPPPPEPESFRLPRRHKRRRGDPDLGPVEYTPLRPADPMEEVKVITGETPAVVVEEAGDDVDVDALFAKLRSEREDEVTKAQEVLAEEPAVEAEADAEPEAQAELQPEATPESEPEAETEPTADVEPPTEEAPSEDESLLERRDGMIDAIEQRAARKLKRVLADEQNEVLDQARRTHKTDVDALLGPVPEQEARYAAAAGIYLAEAAAAGASFYGDADAKSGSVDDLAAELAAAIVRPLRERLASSARDAGGEEEALADGIRACYREWKTQRLGTEARNVVFAAFNRGLFAAAPSGLCMRWLVDDGGSPCPDAEDNALAGPVAKGEEYPTGHQYPPAHPGCRCLLVPVPATAPS